MNFPVNENTIDLSGLNVMTDGFAKPGYQVATVTKAEIKVVANGARMIYLDLQSEAGGKGNDRFTIQHPKASTDEKAAKAQEIGLRKLKTLLTHGTPAAGRPSLDPNAFKGVSTLLGVRVGVLFVQAADFIGNKGDTMKGGIEVTSKGRPYYKPEEIATLAAANPVPVQATAVAPGVSGSAPVKAPF